MSEMISSNTPIPNQITPIAVFFTHKNHSNETASHTIAKMNKPVLPVLMVITPFNNLVIRPV